MRAVLLEPGQLIILWYPRFYDRDPFLGGIWIYKYLDTYMDSLQLLVKWGAPRLKAVQIYDFTDWNTIGHSPIFLSDFPRPDDCLSDGDLPEEWPPTGKLCRGIIVGDGPNSRPL